MKPRQQLAMDLGRKIPGCVTGVDFGHGCLMVDNRIFAFTRADDSAALKLPEARIAGLIDEGEMHRLIMGRRTMREWVVVPNIMEPGNLPLLREAKAYVASLPQEKRRRSAKKSSKKEAKKVAAKKVEKTAAKAANKITKKTAGKTR
ncbi:hypothetical protein [Edaphobacter sp. 12200R-103]|jgi:hypothetical protein|uniref:hypothetical protein n=1 Tax=Edaphobacter sp. 12200R-103 TaxID=2703788 RepID=UPI00138C988A|nr:hypothetical protein [Edaphobacter sp. 12200R-103]QHS52029.1 hypothetical protein GWR55_09960 [Edaphobacter sp. 12200R-103]